MEPQGRHHREHENGRPVGRAHHLGCGLGGDRDGNALGGRARRHHPPEHHEGNGRSGRPGHPRDPVAARRQERRYDDSPNESRRRRRRRDLHRRARLQTATALHSRLEDLGRDHRQRHRVARPADQPLNRPDGRRAPGQLDGTDRNHPHELRRPLHGSHDLDRRRRCGRGHQPGNPMGTGHNRSHDEVEADDLRPDRGEALPRTRTEPARQHDERLGPRESQPPGCSGCTPSRGAAPP